MGYHYFRVKVTDLQAFMDEFKLTKCSLLINNTALRSLTSSAFKNNPV